jgi:hypothetical protein
MQCPDCRRSGEVIFGESLVGFGESRFVEKGRRACDRCEGSGSVPRGQQRGFLWWFFNGWVVVLMDNRHGSSPKEVSLLATDDKQEERLLCACVNTSIRRGEIRSISRRGQRWRRSLSRSDQAAWSKRCRKRGSLARPNMERLTTFSFWTCASTGPLL